MAADVERLTTSVLDGHHDARIAFGVDADYESPPIWRAIALRASEPLT